MTVALRFATGGAASNANAMASLALTRALTRHLLQTQRLLPDEVEFIRERAIEELMGITEDPAVCSARLLILHEFP
jgi:hypothetical protein